MVTVATKLDVPVKLLWAKGGGHSLLGLGDVVIPGTFIALALRCDRARGTRGYFWATLVGYTCALVGTMVVVQVYGRAQPALLYIRCVGRMVYRRVLMDLALGAFWRLWRLGLCGGRWGRSGSGRRVGKSRLDAIGNSVPRKRKRPERRPGRKAGSVRTAWS